MYWRREAVSAGVVGKMAPSRPVQPYGSEGYVIPGGADNNCDCGDENCVN